MQEKRESFVPPDMETLKGYMKDFNIGHESFLTLCLYDPELAKFGIDIDASRPRYHLLVNDLCEIVLINEEVSKHILNNTRLQSSNRLQGGFASVIAEHYPHLLADLFSAIPSVGRVCLPQPEEMVHAISKNPWLFVKLLENRPLSKLHYSNSIL